MNKREFLREIRSIMDNYRKEMNVFEDTRDGSTGACVEYWEKKLQEKVDELLKGARWEK